jgi:lipid A ethanolaminephosphotransferase
MSDRRTFAPPFPGYTLSTEQLVLAAALFWALALNRPFFAAALRGQSWSEAASWSLAAALILGVVSLHALLLGLVAGRRWVKPLVALLTLCGAFAMHYMNLYGVVIDPSMIRNALNTDLAETRELLSWNLALDLLLYGVLPITLLASARIEPRSWGRALKSRLLLLAGALGVLVAALLWQYQPLASLMRNHKEVRYLVTPANSVWSLGSVLAADARGAAQPRQAIV